MTTKDDDKQAQLLVLESLNELFDFAGTEEPKRAVSIAAVLIYDDNTTDSVVSGNLNRQLMLGVLEDLQLQVFHECKQREINELVERTVRDLHLASMPTGPKPN